MAYLNATLVESCLADLADVEFLGRLWSGEIPGSMGSLYETAVMLFFDSGLSDALRDGAVYTDSVDSGLRRLSLLIDPLIEEHDGGWDAASILSDPRIVEITQSAREILTVLMERDFG